MPSVVLVSKIVNKHTHAHTPTHRHGDGLRMISKLSYNAFEGRFMKALKKSYLLESKVVLLVA